MVLRYPLGNMEMYTFLGKCEDMESKEINKGDSMGQRKAGKQPY